MGILSRLIGATSDDAGEQTQYQVKWQETVVEEFTVVKEKLVWGGTEKTINYIREASWPSDGSFELYDGDSRTERFEWIRPPHTRKP